MLGIALGIVKSFVLLLQSFQKTSSTGKIVSQKVSPFPNDKFKTLPNSKSLQLTILNLMKMGERSTIE